MSVIDVLTIKVIYTIPIKAENELLAVGFGIE